MDISGCSSSPHKKYAIVVTGAAKNMFIILDETSKALGFH